jgi:hypothetical protein
MKLNVLLVTASMMAATLGAAAPAHTAGASLLPPEQKQGSIVYVTGGIGLDEAKAVERMARNYPLTLEFLVKAQPRAEFTAAVKVIVTDHTGKVVLDTLCEGPFLLARLPPGRYTVTAEQAGETKTRHVQVVDKSAKRVIFEWDRAVSRPEEAGRHKSSTS